MLALLHIPQPQPPMLVFSGIRPRVLAHLPRTQRLVRPFSSTGMRRSIVDPSNPEEAHLYKIKPVGRLFKQPFDSNHYVLSQQPIYEGPNASQISFMKRWACGFSLLGSYVGYLATGVTGISGAMAACGLIAVMLPLPIIQYFAGSYVSRIFRVYPAGLKRQTLESMTTDETLLVEKISLFGRSTYGVPIKIAKTFATNQKLGWVDWVYVDEMNRKEKMFIEDNLGGMKMDRLWGIVEKNSGIKNTGRFPF